MKIFKLRPPKWVYLLFLTGLAILVTRVTLESKYGNSALLYLLIPFGISVCLHHFIGYSEKKGLIGKYYNHMRDATIIMLGTSVVLFEGFICVLFFMPIYYIAVTIGFGIYGWARANESKNRHLNSYVLPALILILSLEGTTEFTSLQRENQVVHTQIVAADISSLKSNIAQPITFDQKRHWFLKVFPLPVKVNAGTLKAGDIHEVHFIYNRWFFTNTHQGKMQLRIEKVGHDFIKTKIIHNDSYLSNYLKITGTKIKFKKIDNNTTQVSLAINYVRLLDPAWYFSPLQHFAIEKSAEYLMETVIARKYRNT